MVKSCIALLVGENRTVHSVLAWELSHSMLKLVTSYCQRPRAGNLLLGLEHRYLSTSARSWSVSDRATSCTANLIEPHETHQQRARCLSTRAGWFKHSEPHRTYTILTSTELARCVGCFCTRSGWFKHIEPHRTYTNHTITELAGWCGSCRFAVLEPPRSSA